MNDDTAPDWARLIRLAVEDADFWHREIDWPKEENRRRFRADMFGWRFKPKEREPVTVRHLYKRCGVDIDVIKAIAAGTFKVRPGSAIERGLARLAAGVASEAACIQCRIPQDLIEQAVFESVRKKKRLPKPRKRRSAKK